MKTVEECLAGLDGGFLVLQTGRHVDAVSDAMTVSDDQRWTIVGFGFEERLERVLVFRAHRDRRDVDVTVGHGDEAKILFRGGLPAGGELGDSAAWGRF